MDIRFAIVTSRNPSRTVSTTIQLRLRDFSKNEFLLVLSQPIGFHPNRAHIRTQHPRKPIVTCPLFENGVMQSHWLEIEGVFWGGRTYNFREKIALDLLLDERRIPGKFGCASTYGVQMHQEQTDKHSPLYIRSVSLS
jgi:hypothetical protein